MRNRSIFLLFVVSVILLTIGYLLPQSDIVTYCPWYSASSPYSCNYYWIKLGDALFYGMGALAISFFALMFVPRAVSAWSKFAIWFIPLAALLFVFWQESQGSLGVVNFGIYPEQIFLWVSASYLVISLTIIGWVGILKR